MPIDVGRFTTELTVTDGDLPLSAAQLERLVQAVLRRLDEKQRAERQARDSTAIRNRAAPPPRGR